MASPRKNLLEAFQHTDAQSAPTGESPAPAGAPVSAGPPQPSLFGVAPGVASEGVPEAGRGRFMALIGVGFVLSFLLGFLVGRGPGEEVLAGEPLRAEPLVAPAPSTQPRSFQTGPGQGRPGQGTAGVDEELAHGGGSLEDSALFDTGNKYTVVVAAYSNTNPDPAWATYEHLRDMRLDVFPPVASKNLILVLAGAAPTVSELRRIESAVQDLRRDGDQPYADAYVQGIDRLIPRTQ